MAITIIGMLLFSGVVQGATVVPPLGLLPLNQAAIPEPLNLYQFVKNKAVAIKLGKAFFWDMQVGSDGMTACATCHFSAGTDTRTRNTLHPGKNGLFDVQQGPNQTVQPTDFPFHQRQTPADFQAATVVRDADDVVGAQGVRLNQLVNVVPGSRFDVGVPLPDPVFNVNGVNVRQVTGRNTPSVINAVFNFANFWDGRASAFFNGSSPFGPLDPNAGVWFNTGGALTKQKVSIQFGSLASQATGPPLNDVEMSYRGRTFPQLGRKMLSLTPLAVQTVHPYDSELGAYSRATIQPNGSLGGEKGLKTSYAQMIRDAFQDNLWNSSQLTPDGFTQMEANFSLYWGLAIQLYEATLVSDDTKFDQFLAGDLTALTDQQQEGFNIFFGVGRCDVCHGGSTLTNATVGAAAFLNLDTNLLIELMPVASGKQIIYDLGYNNTAVRKTNEDFGRGADSPFPNLLTGDNIPLSFSMQAELQAQNLLPFLAPLLPANIPFDFPVANDGSFKVPGLRNIELTGPYMHNGGMRTLEETVLFYTRGGDFPNNNKANLDINIAEILAMQNEPLVQSAVVDFMKSFTDDRVREEAAPFDHPEIFIPDGDSVNDMALIHMPATDDVGNKAPAPVVTLTPSLTSPQLTGTPVTFSAAVQSGVGPFEYRFWVNSGSGFSVVQDYSAANTFAWTPAATGAYDILVDVRSVGTSIMRETSTKLFFYQIISSVAATGVSVVPDLTSPQASGTPITLTASGQGGSGSYEYRFWLNSGSGYSIVQDYGAANTLVWTPAATGNYDILVDVRNTGSTALREASTNLFYYQIISSSAATGVTVTPDLASPQATGTPITLTASGQGGSGSYEYQFWLNSGAGYSIVQEYSAANTFVWTPAVTGNYDILVDVRNTGSTASREALAKLFFYQVQ